MLRFIIKSMEMDETDEFHSFLSPLKCSWRVANLVASLTQISCFLFISFY